jgi:hypothetical protein
MPDWGKRARWSPPTDAATRCELTDENDPTGWIRAHLVRERRLGVAVRAARPKPYSALRKLISGRR